MCLIQIDEEKCKKDGVCVAECPMVILHQETKDSHPAMVPGGDQICIRCGHCVVVCPHGAFDHKEVPIDKCPPIDKEKSITQEQATQFLRSRRAIRHYKDRPVERNQIQELISTARYAPTGSNSQPVAWTVFMNEGDIHRIGELTIDWMRTITNDSPQDGVFAYLPLIIAGWDGGIDVITRKAPSLVIASAPDVSANSIVDVSIALSYLELAAISMGLGTCWAGLVQMAMVNSKKLQEFIGLPRGPRVHYPMMVGYPKFRYHRMPERKDPPIDWR